MKSNTATYVSLFFITILAVFYLLSSVNQSRLTNISTIDAGFFPLILSIALIILCLISFVQTIFKKEVKKIPLRNFKLVLITIGLSIIFFITWSVLGYC